MSIVTGITAVILVSFAAWGDTPAGDDGTLVVRGVFDEVAPAVVTFRPESTGWEATVIEARAEGPVSKGDVLVRLQADGLAEKIRLAEIDLAANYRKLLITRGETRLAASEMELKLKSAGMRVAASQRTLDEKVKINAPQRLKRSAEGVRDWQIQRKENEEQFQVLLGMYQADEVLEPTERMDLEIQQRGLDRQLLGRSRVIERHDVLKNFTIPREISTLELGLRKVTHARDALRSTADLLVAQAGLSLARSEHDFKRQEHALQALMRDREALTMVAPAAGYAVAGHYAGKWQALQAASERTRTGAQVSAGQVLFTIVQAAPSLVRASIPESALFQVQVGQAATLVPTSAADVSLPATVTRIARYSNKGEFEIWLRARTRHKRLFPGNTCQVRIEMAQ